MNDEWRMSNDYRMRGSKDESRMRAHSKANTISSFEHLSLLRHSSFVLRHSVCGPATFKHPVSTSRSPSIRARCSIGKGQATALLARLENAQFTLSSAVKRFSLGQAGWPGTSRVTSRSIIHSGKSAHLFPMNRQCAKLRNIAAAFGLFVSRDGNVSPPSLLPR